jgi:hypothetical protein
VQARQAFRLDSSRTLNCCSNFIGLDHPSKPANGDQGMIRKSMPQINYDDGTLKDRMGAVLGSEAAKNKTGRRMFQGQVDVEAATPVDAGAIQDVLFERGMYWASGRSGIVDLVAAHKWFNLAALKGRVDAIAMRREVAALMSEAEIAAAQREARAWMTMH